MISARFLKRVEGASREQKYCVIAYAKLNDETPEYFSSGLTWDEARAIQIAMVMDWSLLWVSIGVENALGVVRYPYTGLSSSAEHEADNPRWRDIRGEATVWTNEFLKSKEHSGDYEVVEEL